MEYFRNSGLFELYGSTECGWVTMLQPEEQLSKLGSVGRECVGSRPIRLLDADGNEVADGEAGELYSCNALHLRRLLEAAGEDQGGVPRRLLHRRRSRPPRRGRLHLSGRPQEQHDHLRRRERLSVRGGDAAGRAPEGQGRRGDRRARCQMGRARACGDHPARRRGADAGRDPRLVQGPHRRLQAAALGRHSSARRRCRAPPPARSCIACCARSSRMRRASGERR